jgi:hypothetical protein
LEKEDVQKGEKCERERHDHLLMSVYVRGKSVQEQWLKESLTQDEALRYARVNLKSSIIRYNLYAAIKT